MPKRSSCCEKNILSGALRENELAPARGSLGALARWILALAFVAAAASSVAAVVADAPAESERRDPADEMANQTARDVFAGKAYWWKRTSEVKSTSAVGRVFSFIYEKSILPILQWISDFLERIFRWLLESLGLGTGDWSKGVPFLWTIVIALVLFVAWRLARLYRRPQIVRQSLAGQPTVDVLPQADQLLEQSRIALAQGNHRAAVRLALLSLLAWLQDRGQLKYDSSRSNREYQRDLRGWPDSATVFAAVATPFERCWYGGRNIDALQVQEVIALCGNHFLDVKDSA